MLSPKASRALLRSDPGAAAAVEEAARVRLLTARERDVLVLVAAGLSNVEIGARVHLSPGTVKDHVSAILAKLRVTSRVQAALLAQRAGLLDSGEGAGRADEHAVATPSTARR